MKVYRDFDSIAIDLLGGIKINQPNCMEIMEPKLVEYVVGESLILEFPVLEKFSNPGGGMQGGFISAAFDNVFGSFCFYETKGKPIATIDISTSYQRPIFIGDELIIKVEIKAMGKTIIHMTGEGRNKEGKLIATATTNFILLNSKSK